MVLQDFALTNLVNDCVHSFEVVISDEAKALVLAGVMRDTRQLQQQQPAGVTAETHPARSPTHLLLSI